MEPIRDVIVIGGGLAGLTASIALANAGISVIVIEKHSYPRHKVCGEFVSNEVLPYLKELGIDLSYHVLPKISKCIISSTSGDELHAELPMGGFGISRYKFEDILYRTAIGVGVDFIFETVINVEFKSDIFEVTTSSAQRFFGKSCIGAFGKRSAIERGLERKHLAEKSPWLAVKNHYRCDFPSDVVALHSFSGGYCGVSMVEDGIANICYLSDYKSFRKFPDPIDFQKEVLCKNPHLKKIFADAIPVFDKPLTIGQISFDKKSAVENHMLMAGDAAGLIHPLCGNGMAMAIHSGKLASEAVIQYLSGNVSRESSEQLYTGCWNGYFSGRMLAGRMLSKVLLNKTLSAFAMKMLRTFPRIVPEMIKKTHGKPFLT